MHQGEPDGVRHGGHHHFRGALLDCRSSAWCARRCSHDEMATGIAYAQITGLVTVIMTSLVVSSDVVEETYGSEVPSFTAGLLAAGVQLIMLAGVAGYGATRHNKACLLCVSIPRTVSAAASRDR